MTPVWRWPTIVVVGVLVVIQVVALVSALHDADRDRLHGVPVAITAPDAVSGVLAAEADDLDGRPFEATAVASIAEAQRKVRRGEVAAALEVDLSGTRDRLVVDGARSEKVRDALVDQVRLLEAARGRTVEVTTTATAVPPERVRVTALVVTAGGFLVGLLVGAAVLRPRAPGGRRELGLATLGVVVLGAVTPVLLGSIGEVVAVVVAGVVGAGVAAMVAGALECLAGLPGLVLGLVAHVVLAVPLLRDLDPVLLQQPWAGLLRVTPTWATFELVDAAATGRRHASWTAVLVLAAWAVVAAAGLVAVWRRQERQPVVPSQTVEALPPPRWRRRTGVVLVLTLVAALATTLLLPQPGLTAVAPPSLASETACVATGTIDDLQDLNRISAEVRGDDSFQGGDVGATVLPQDGRRLMLFGDTLRGSGFPGQQFVRNSMLVVGPDCIQSVLPADGGAIIPDRRGGSGAPVGYWPMSLGRVERPGYDLVAVTTQRVQATGEGVFDFRILGPSVAVFVVPEGETPQLVTVRDLGPDVDDVTRPQWGAATVVHDGWLYLYGTARPDEEGVFGFSLRVARVRPDDVLDQDQWRYWDGTDWQADAERAVELVPAVGGVSETLSVFRRGDTWYALSKRDDVLGTDLVVWRAPDPWGPFDAGTVVGELPSDAATGELRYMPLAHPDLLPRKGTMVVSYSRNRTDVGEVIEDPFTYRPRFLRLPLP